MFVDFSDPVPPPRWEPEPPPRPRLSARDEKLLLWLVGLNLLGLVVAPIAGGSVIHLAWRLLAG